MSIDEALKYSNKGIATVDTNCPVPALNNERFVVVGISESKTCIAIAGRAGDFDIIQSTANACLIAHAWNHIMRTEAGLNK